MKVFLTSALLLTTVLKAAPALASCDYNEVTDLRQKFPQVFENLPVRDQGQYGICYAYAGTFMVDFHRFKSELHKNGKILDKQNSSAVEAGILQAATISMSTDEVGGSSCDVINAISKRGYSCDRMDFLNEASYKDIAAIFHRESVGKLLVEYLGDGIKKYPYKTIEDFKLAPTTVNQRSFVKKFDILEKEMNAIFTGVKPYNFDGIQKSYSFPKSFVPTRDQMFQILHNSLTKKEWNQGSVYLNILAQNICAQRKHKVAKYNCKQESSDRGQDLVREIDFQISNLKPIGIDYCPNMMGDKNYKGIVKGERQRSCNTGHASVVIGRKWVAGNKCMYLIRNSWGANARYAWETSNGDIWVEEKALENNLFSVDVL